MTDRPDLEAAEAEAQEYELGLARRANPTSDQSPSLRPETVNEGVQIQDPTTEKTIPDTSWDAARRLSETLLYLIEEWNCENLGDVYRLLQDEGVMQACVRSVLRTGDRAEEE